MATAGVRGRPLNSVVSHQLNVARAKFQELTDAFDFVSSGQPMENEAYLSKETGAVYWHSEYSEDIEELPNDIDDGEKYLLIPHKNDLGLGKSLALRFAEEFLSGDLGRFEKSSAVAVPMHASRIFLKTAECLVGGTSSRQRLRSRRCWPGAKRTEWKLMANNTFETDRDASWPHRARDGLRARRCGTASWSAG